MKLMFKTPGEGNGVMGEATATKKSGRIKDKKLLITVSILALFLIAAGVFLAAQAQKKPNITIGTGSEISGNVEVLSRQQQEQVADVWVMSAAFDMDWAYAKAVSLSVLEKHQESLKVFQSIEETGKAPYYIYVDYALAAGRAQDTKLAAELMSTAIEKIKTDPSLNETDKTVLIRRLKSKVDVFQEDAKG